MTPNTLQAVLRKLSEAGPPEADADLLRRFASDRDEAAFAGLVRRHGRLVWAVCRHLTRSDAEADDAFQATFLVLIRNSGKVRDAGRLSAWLHGVAYRVCSKARQAAKRRNGREAASARAERNGSAVPDSAWDRALATVHEEVAKLPETLRVPFVLCCLEGKGQTEAAEQLGWKLGTLSGRLTRAKDAVLARLDARGLTLGVVATVGLNTPPSAVTAKVLALVEAGVAIPGSILQLSQGVVGMSVNQVKFLAAGLLVACGLGVSGGAKWIATADAQSKPAQQPLAERVKQLEAELAKAKEATDQAKRESMARYYEAVVQAQGGQDQPNVSTKKWDYNFIAVSEMTQEEFGQFLQKNEDRGWEYVGTTPLKDKHPNVWVFRKPRTGKVWNVPSALPTSGVYQRYYDWSDALKQYQLKQYEPAAQETKQDDPAAIEAEIKRLQNRLSALKVQDASGNTWVSLPGTGVASDDELLGKLLYSQAAKKFGGSGVQILVTEGGLRVFGTKEVTDWAKAMVKKLTEK